MESCGSIKILCPRGNWKKNYKVGIADDLADHIPQDHILTAAEAVSSGIDLSHIKAEDGAAVLSKEDVKQLRQMNAKVNGETYVGNDGNVYIPSNESL